MNTDRRWMDYQQWRMSEAAQARIAYDGVWWRSTSAWVTGGGGSSLQGPYGQMLRSQIQARFAGGPATYQGEGEDGAAVTLSCYPIRWQMLEALLDPSYDPLREAMRALALLYRRPIIISGDVDTEMLQWLRDRCALDVALQARQDATIFMRSCAIRPTLEEWRDGQYYPAGVTVITPDRAMAIPSRSNPRMAEVFIETAESGGKGRALVWDVSNPLYPVWGEWASAESYMRGAEPLWSMAGAEYPWRYAGEPIMPAVCYQWQPVEGELLPVDPGELQSALDLLMDRVWIEYVKHAGSFQKAIITSGLPLDGLDQSMVDPTAVINLWGDDGADVKVLPDSMASVEAQWAMYAQKKLEWAQRYDTGFEVRESGSAKSGVAILLEATGKELLRQRMVTATEPLDAALIRALVATHNYSQRARLTSIRMVDGEPRFTPGLPAQPTMDMLIPEGSVEVSYPHYWNRLEVQQKIEEVRESVAQRLESPRALWLLVRGLDDDRPDGPNWVQAGEAIKQALADHREFAALGYGMEASALSAAADRLAVGEQEAATLSLNGAQMEAALQIVDRVLTGKAPRATGVGQLMTFLGITEGQAEQIMGEIGRTFEPAKPEGYDVALRDTASADNVAVATAEALRGLGFSEEQVIRFLAERGVLKGVAGAGA